MNNIAKANIKLEQILKNKKITEEGKQWLIATLDPFHDTKIRCEGYPDRSSGNSIVQVIRASRTISAPPGIPANTNWNAAFVMDNDMIPGINRHLDRDFTILVERGENALLPTGGLSWVASIGAVPDLFTTVGAQGTAWDHIALDNNYNSSRYRVLGMGFEVANTTADIYKQGAVCVWEQPSPGIHPQTFQQLTQTPEYAVPVNRVTSTRPPLDIAQALLLGGSQQWAAAEGCYCTSVMSNLDNPATYIDNAGKLMMNVEDSNLVANTCWSGLTIPSGHAVLPPGGSYRIHYETAHKLVPYNMKGAYFTGLSPQTSLVANAVWILETFPTSTSPLVTLATPSPCLDPYAMEIYSHVTCKMPVGVRFADNGLGDFFLGIVDTIAEVVTTIGRPLVAIADGYQQYRAAAKANAKGLPGSTWNTNGKTKALLPKKN